jgi:peptidyl-dipeptidase A
MCESSLLRKISSGSALMAIFIAGCGDRDAAPVATAASMEAAPQFIARVNRELLRSGIELNATDWVQNTYITADTQLINARATERNLEQLARLLHEARRFEGQKLDADSARSLELLKLVVLEQGSQAPAPDDPDKRSELATIATRLSATYGEGKYCVAGKCRNLDELSATLASSRNVDALTEAWTGWHTISAPMRNYYTRFVELANEGAREMGYADAGVMSRSAYDMSPENFDKEVERLWEQVKPLYAGLQCYTRTQLAKRYGEDKVPAGKPIPAQLLGNMWAQQWNNIYGDILEPYPGVASLDVDKALKAQHYDARRMTESAESFYTSLGFPKLPATFWERSMLTRPRDREVVCHASAWNMDGKSDVRIKQCIQPNEEELTTIYHELGHVYYYLTYRDQPFLYQNGANNGFHEAIGDTIVLSMTPDYLHRVGLAPATKPSPQAVIDQQMKLAADRVAFLPFAKLVDQWRWKVASGEIKPENYNAAWWELRRRYQGVAPPVARSETDFDPGAKYHVAANVSYTRYFLAFILQFQFHRALCQAAGFKGPLHECSIYGNAEAGKRFAAMLALGQSRPWPEALEKLTGARQMDASAIVDYFQPLMLWLEEKNKGQKCGWEG